MNLPERAGLGDALFPPAEGKDSRKPGRAAKHPRQRERRLE
jgi:hypothetical protein